MKVIIAAAFLMGFSPLHGLASPAEHTLHELAPMLSPRAGHTATALSDGSVLIVGGFKGNEHDIAGVELFDADRRRFHAIGNALTPRQSHTASALPDGRVLIAGGYDAHVRMLATAEIYNPTTRKFSPAGRMNTPRANHVAITLSDGRVALLGEGSIDMFDPQTGAFAEVEGVTVPHVWQAAVLLNDGRIFIAMTDQSTAIVDLHSGRITPTANMSVAREKFDAVVLADGRVLVTGGSDEQGARGRYNSSEIFDPSRNSFTPATPMNKARYKHRGASLLLPNGKALIAGGAQQAELYDPTSNTFTLIGGESRLHGSFSAVTFLNERRVLITGGYRLPTSPSAGAWLYEW